MRTFIADRGTGEPISLGAALLAGKKVPPDATGLLADDHRVVLGWFSWHEETEDPELRGEIAAKICMALRAHMAAEEEALYPGARVQTDPRLVDRAQAEHAAAKGLMERIETAAPGQEQDDLVRQLETEIRSHVVEEETELFPGLRADGMDLYAVGRAVAAIRVDSLFQQTGRKDDRELKEYPNMQISSDEARDFFITGLKSCHATTRQGRALVEAQVKRLQNYPDVKRKLEAHLDEKDAQLERLEKLLSGYGEKRSKVKDAAMTAAAGAAGLAASAADDEVIKNSFATLAQAKYEAAAFETLILFAAAAGENQALRPLQQSLSESRGLASFVEENLRATGMRFLQLRSRGAEASH